MSRIRDITKFLGLTAAANPTNLPLASTADALDSAEALALITGGNAITVTSGVVNHDDTSSQSSVNNSGSNFIQDITLDTYGHVTAITSAEATGGGGLGDYGAANSTGTAASATGTDAIAIGEGAVAAGTAGIAIGRLAYAHTGQDCLAIGDAALENNTGSIQIAVGTKAGAFSGSANSSSYFGYYAGFNCGGSSCTYLGYTTGYNKGGNGNTAVGYGSMTVNTGNGYLNTAVGHQSLRRITSGYHNVGIGADAGQNINTGYHNTMLGVNAGANVSTGYGNVAVGRFADTGNNSTCIVIGYGSYTSNTSGQNNQIVIGTGLLAKGQNTAYIGGATGIYNQANTASFSTTSDERVKTNITDYTLGLDALGQVNVKTFNYRSDSDIATNSPELADSDGLVHEGLDTEKTDIGIIAQELELILPNTVTIRDNGIKSVNKDELFWVMLNSIKELKARVEALENA